ncbi:MAG TPA: N-acetylmuramoyl-L-alanine amidase, partial [Thermoanaerobaculia bacterium]|nr:N-acetylmuramoyl-L-alanine amidase [Thermoanaerobaculia bacterium]
MDVSYNIFVRWWVWWVFLVAVSASASVVPSSKQSIVRADLTPQITAAFTRDYEIEVLVTPHAGDAWSRLAKRLSGDAAQWKRIASFNAADDVLTTERPVRIPFSLLRPELQRQTVRALFPHDRATSRGWRHVVTGGTGIEGESLWKIAEWFTGDGANYSRIRKANETQGLSTRKGDVILIPRDLLAAAFRSEVEGENASKAATEVRQSEDDPVERAPENENAAQAAAEIVAVGQPSLTYERTGPEPYAVYRLQKGEALYSSVAIRFTGRVYAKDVGEVVDRLVRLNSIGDVSRLPVGYAVKIPLDLLLPEYRPDDDPARLARETSQRESAKLARRTRARNLSGVHVILDPGHGGRDVGTYHDGVAEAHYVYDVVCRVRQLLEQKSGAKVSITTRSDGTGYRILDRDELSGRSDHVVLTNPRYPLEDATVGVNLRWYLANSIFRRALKSGVPKEKVVFISIHADSLHPALRGSMAYIPGERFVQGSYRKSGEVYLARAEVRERPVVRHTAEESLRAEGLSRDLAESIIEAISSRGLRVHPFHPVRDNVVRDGREWVPAVIRYNTVPTRLL